MSDKRLVGVEIVIQDGVKTTTSSYSDKPDPEDVTDTKVEVTEHTGKIKTGNISNN